MADLSQQKIEHAVLWSIVEQSYDAECICAESVAPKLLGVAPPSQIQAAIDHLLSCGYLTDRSAPMQKHYEPARKGYIKIQQLKPLKSSFVGRLSLAGPQFLHSPEARDAKLESRLERDVSDLGSEAGVAPPSVNVVNTFSPVNSNVQQGPAAMDDVAKSAKIAGWFGAWGAWAGAVIAIITLVWILHEAKVF